MTIQTLPPPSQWSEALSVMRQRMEAHPFWRRVIGTPLESDLPVMAAEVAMKWVRGMRDMKEANPMTTLNEEMIRALMVPLIGKTVTPKTVDIVIQAFREHLKEVATPSCPHGPTAPGRECVYCAQERYEQQLTQQFTESFRAADAEFERLYPEQAKRAKEPLTEQERDHVKKHPSVSGLDPKWAGES